MYRLYDDNGNHVGDHTAEEIAAFLLLPSGYFVVQGETYRVELA